MVVVEVGGESYFMNKILKKAWDSIRDGKLAKLDEDRVYVVDGREGTGKSVFALQQAAYIDPTIIEDVNGKPCPRITFTVEDTLKAIRTSKSTKNETRVIIFDEAFRGLSSKSALSKVNKSIVQAMMEMRQNNLVLFIVTPSFFLLEMYPAVLRSNTLFHIKKLKGNRKRMFSGFSYKKKARIYQIGIKKGWSYPQGTRLKDYFFNKYPGGKEFEEKYRKKKYDSLQVGEEEEEVINKQSKIKFDRDMIIYSKRKEGLTYIQISEWLKTVGLGISKETVGKICQSFEEKKEKLRQERLLAGELTV